MQERKSSFSTRLYSGGSSRIKKVRAVDGTAARIVDNMLYVVLNALMSLTHLIPLECYET